MQSQFDIRQASASDLNFIYDSFLKSMRSDSSVGRSCSKDVFFREFPKIIDQILNRAITIVACVSNDPSTLIGYLIYEPSIVHYIVVKNAFRNLGVAKTLVSSVFSDDKGFDFSISCKTNEVRAILKKHPSVKYNPFILFKGV